MGGDVANGLEKLRVELRRWRHDGELRLTELATGDPAGFLPLLHFVLLQASVEIARWIVHTGYELTAKSDLRFVETVYRLARQELNYNPILTSKQFFATGFAERKLQMLTELSALCRSKHADLVRERAMGRKGSSMAAEHQAGGSQTLATPRRRVRATSCGTDSPGERPRAAVPRATKMGARPATAPAQSGCRLPQTRRSSTCLLEDHHGPLPRVSIQCDVPARVVSQGSAAGCGFLPMDAPLDFPPPMSAPPPRAAVPIASQWLSSEPPPVVSAPPIVLAASRGLVPIDAGDVLGEAEAVCASDEADYLAQVVEDGPMPATPRSPSSFFMTALDEESVGGEKGPFEVELGREDIEAEETAQQVDSSDVDETDHEGATCNSAFAVESTPEPLMGIPPPVTTIAAAEEPESETYPQPPNMSAAAEGAALAYGVIEELASLRKLLEHTSAQLEALRVQSEASANNVNARLALMEGRVKLLEAERSHPPPEVPSAPPAASDAATPMATRQALGNATSLIDFDSEPAAAAPVQKAAVDAWTPPRGAFKMPPRLAQVSSEEGGAAGHEEAGEGGVVACKGAYAHYLSTQAFIADISRKFNETQDLIHQASSPLRA